MPGQRRRRWPDIKPSLAHGIVFARLEITLGMDNQTSEKTLCPWSAQANLVERRRPRADIAPLLARTLPGRIHP